jgi:hypothetical protein
MVIADWTVKDALIDSIESGKDAQEALPSETSANPAKFLFKQPLAELPRLPTSEDPTFVRATLQVMLLDPTWTVDRQDVKDFWDKDKVRARLRGK